MNDGVPQIGYKNDKEEKCFRNATKEEISTSFKPDGKGGLTGRTENEMQEGKNNAIRNKGNELAPVAKVADGMNMAAGVALALPVIIPMVVVGIEKYFQNPTPVNQAINGYFNVPGVETSRAGVAGQAAYGIQKGAERGYKAIDER